MEMILYVVLSMIIGSLLGWFLAKARSWSAIQSERELAQQKYSELEKELVAYKATATSQMQAISENLDKKSTELTEYRQAVEQYRSEISGLNTQLSTANANLEATKQTVLDRKQTIDALTEELTSTKNELSTSNKALAVTNADHNALKEKLQTQKEEIEQLGIKFNTEFENIANRILDNKTDKFTKLNSENLKNILDPLGKHITEFKTKVEEVYDKEAKERFSLGEKVKELAALNQVISDEARNLTRALKGESKTQGRWGEIILETILEKSGLRKGEEFFMEYQLYDPSGVPLRSEAKGSKMRPDAVIKYPDQRHVVIDAKVSLSAYVRFTEATEPAVQQLELAAHVQSLKNHINELSLKAYDDYDKTLDFVMMFVPNEAAYFAAIQADANLWEFAYAKRILLISPTNLITSLRLIVELWKREYQNKNAQAIAERGAKLYDKFVGFVDNLEAVGKHIGNAQDKYNEAYKQLHTGNDSLTIQATKLKQLGVKTKKELSSGLLDKAESSLPQIEVLEEEESADEVELKKA